MPIKGELVTIWEEDIIDELPHNNNDNDNNNNDNDNEQAKNDDENNDATNTKKQQQRNLPRKTPTHENKMRY